MPFPIKLMLWFCTHFLARSKPKQPSGLEPKDSEFAPQVKSKQTSVPLSRCAQASLLTARLPLCIRQGNQETESLFPCPTDFRSTSSKSFTEWCTGAAVASIWFCFSQAGQTNKITQKSPQDKPKKHLSKQNPPINCSKGSIWDFPEQAWLCLSTQPSRYRTDHMLLLRCCWIAKRGPCQNSLVSKLRGI